MAFLTYMEEILMKLFLILLFIPLFLHCHQKTVETASPKDIVSCKYMNTVYTFGNMDCTRMFCNAGRIECPLKNDSILKKSNLICPAVKNSKGGISCPKAYECVISEVSGEDKIKEKTEDGSSIVTEMNNKCPGLDKDSVDSVTIVKSNTEN